MLCLRGAFQNSKILQPGTPDENLDQIWQGLVAFWKEHPCSDHFSHLKMTMFLKATDPHDSFPSLSGRAVEIKNLMPALAAVWADHCEADSVPHQAVLFGLLESAHMDEILDLHAQFDKLPADAAKNYTDAAYSYARAQAACADHWNREHGGGLMIFDVTCKTHWLLHGADDAAFLNPRLSWNYAGEDFMGKCKVLQASCCKGNSVAKSTNKFAVKYSYALHLIFQEFEDGLR